MGWLRDSRAYGLYARRVRPRLLGRAVPVPAELQREWEDRTRDGSGLRVDWRDEMFLYFHRPFRTRRALGDYLRTGSEAQELVREILARLDRTPEEVTSFLEFACGYGRNTRFLSTLFDPTRHHVSDVDPQAVEFNARTFGTQGLPSALEPGDWTCERSFDLVFVASLFSHLPRDRWTAWLGRLAEATARGGHLVVTTHGLDWLPEDSAAERVEEGFRYLRCNETSGRLASADYGSTYVSREWVRERLPEQGLVEATPMLPNALWGQDVWVLRHA